MSVTKFGTIGNSAGKGGLKAEDVQTLIDLSIQRSNKRLKMTSEADDTPSIGYSIITENPEFGPDFTLRSLIPGVGIQFQAVDEGKKLLVMSTLNTPDNANYFGTSGKVYLIKFGRVNTKVNNIPLFPSEYTVVGSLSTIKGLVDGVTTDSEGPSWFFRQQGFQCSLTVAAMAFGSFEGSDYPDPYLGFGPYTYPGDSAPTPTDHALSLTIFGLPTFAQPDAGFFNVQIGTFNLSLTHQHVLPDATGGRFNNDIALVQHQHYLGGLTAASSPIMTVQVSVSIRKFTDGAIELWLRNLTPSLYRLLDCSSTSSISISWTAIGAVDGTLDEKTSGVILSANGLTADTDAVQRIIVLENAVQDQAAAIDAVVATTATKADTNNVYAKSVTYNKNEADAKFAPIGQTVDLTDYYTKGEVNGITENMVSVSMYNTDRQQDIDSVYTKSQTYTRAEVKALNDAQDVITATKANLSGAVFTGVVIFQGNAQGTGFTNGVNAAIGINSTITGLKTVPHTSLQYGAKSYTFVANVPRTLDATGANVQSNSWTAGQTVQQIEFISPQGFFRPSWTGQRVCTVLAQINFQYSAGDANNQVTIWLHDLGTSLPGNTPSINANAVGNLGIGGVFSYVTTLDQPGFYYTAQFNANLKITGGNYYGMAMMSPSEITYNVTAAVSMQALYGV
jgi:hypothetical protein